MNRRQKKNAMIHKDADLSQAGESGFGMVGSERMSWFCGDQIVYSIIIIYYMMIDNYNNRVIYKKRSVGQWCMW